MIRVMIIDDSILARKALEKTFQTDPEFEVVGMAGNGREALEKIPQCTPTVVTCDLEMPVMDGVETLMHLRQKHPGLKVVILSSLTQPNSKKEQICKNLGAHAVLAKPMEHSNLKVAEKGLEILSTIKGL